MVAISKKLSRLLFFFRGLRYRFRCGSLPKVLAIGVGLKRQHLVCPANGFLTLAGRRRNEGKLIPCAHIPRLYEVREFKSTFCLVEPSLLCDSGRIIAKRHAYKTARKLGFVRIRIRHHDKSFEHTCRLA